MWTTQHTATTDAPPTAVWAALRDLHHGTALGPSSDHFELHGPFAVGTRVSITPAGEDTITSVITELDEPRSYADTTEHGDLTLVFRHVLTPLDDGGTEVTHHLTIDGPSADQAGPQIGRHISADFPTAMSELLTAAAQRAGARR